MILNDIDNAYVGNEEVEKIYLGEELIYSTGPAPVDYRSMPLTVEALSGGTLQLTNTTSQTDIYYNLNDDGWQLINTNNMSFNLQAGDIIQFGATEAVDLQQYSAGRSLFSGNTLAFKVYGNIESLEYGYGDFTNRDTSVYLESAFTYCFRSCSGLTDASNLVLPATSLAQRCYTAMFWGCTSLTSAPELPSTTLTQSCYSSMFQGCRSLTQAPELPATALESSCYAGMFSGCTSLNYIKCLATNPISSLFGNVYNWVNGVQTNSGTFIKNPLTTSWTTGTNGIPSGWTVVDNVSQ